MVRSTKDMHYITGETKKTELLVLPTKSRKCQQGNVVESNLEEDENSRSEKSS